MLGRGHHGVAGVFIRIVDPRTCCKMRELHSCSAMGWELQRCQPALVDQSLPPPCRFMSESPARRAALYPQHSTPKSSPWLAHWCCSSVKEVGLKEQRGGLIERVSLTPHDCVLLCYSGLLIYLGQGSNVSMQRIKHTFCLVTC